MRKLLWSFGLIGMMLCLPEEMMAQDTIKKKTSKMVQTANELKKSLDANDDAKIAKNYEELAKGFLSKGDTTKAEDYYKRALTTYRKLKLKADQTRVSRVLAKIQESQDKYSEAIKSYEVAEETAADNLNEQLNSNDANRLRNQYDPKVQKELSTSNIRLLDKSNKKEEVADAYVQKAEINLQEDNREEAIQNYKQALNFVKDKPKEAINIQNQIAKVYVASNQFSQAIAINEKLLDEARKANDFPTQIKQLQALGTIYFQQQQPEKAVDLLENAYRLAAEKGQSAEAKKSLVQLADYYKSNNNEQQSLVLYETFFNDLDRLIASDTALINEKTFQITEGKIRQLEKEKVLKDELISRKNTFNYFLLGSMLLLLLFFGLIAKALYSIKIKNKEIALQSLRREMNPHFIFNSLNSVNQFISQNKELEANKYLTSYSNLMRNMMENSNKDFVTLSNEIEQLQKYLDLEHLRFRDKFEFKITIDEKIDTETVFFPNMLIQPQLENAIWHGLRYLEHKGMLHLKFELSANIVVVTIEDDGIGLTKSQELKTQNQKVHQSRGLTNTHERIALLNQLYKKNIAFRVGEKSPPETGTVVTISCILIDKL